MQRKKQDIIVGVVFTIEKAGRRMRWKLTDLHTNRWQVSGQKDIT